MVVVDSSVLIPLGRIGKLLLLKKFFKKVVITDRVYKEVKSGGPGTAALTKAVGTWVLVEQPQDHQEIVSLSNLEGIAEADASLIILAQQRKDTLLSNDYALIRVARSREIECWWLTTFLLRCLQKGSITKKEAKKILFELVGAGMHLDNSVYAALLREMEK